MPASILSAGVMVGVLWAMCGAGAFVGGFLTLMEGGRG
jgi:hypothetical protein